MPTESTGSFSSEQLVKDLLVFVFVILFVKIKQSLILADFCLALFLRIYFENILWIDFLGAASLYRGDNCLGAHLGAHLGDHWATIGRPL